MKELKDATALVFDHGLFLSLAERLSRDFKRVLYHSPFEEGFSLLNKGIIGDGLERVERCNDIWAVKNEVDLWCFPDIEHSGLQLELESQGCNVWGSRRGDSLELLREKFHAALERLHLDVPKFRTIVGLTKLREFLKADGGEFYIKISKYRGSFETSRFRSYDLDECLLDQWAVKFGPSKDLVRFMVFDPIETELEIGGDTWCIDGQWPDLMLRGDEAKDKSYLSVVTKRGEMPEQIAAVLDAFGPELGSYSFRNFWSMEIRVKGKKAYFGDATCRCPMPSTGSHLEIWENISEVIYAGANGEIVQPKPVAQCSGEVILSLKCERGNWGVTEIPDELKQWVKLANCCEIDGKACFPPDECHGNAIGWMVAIGNSVDEVIETMKEQIALLPSGVSADMEPMGDLLKEIREAKKEGIEFGDEEIPEPETVLANGD